MSDATATSAGLRQIPRDSRVDALRGIALIMIFIDHIPGNLLSQATLRNFGFADAAELFVLLAGFASMVAYGGSFAREGVLLGLRRVFLRCLRLYLFQAVMMLAVLVVVSAWLRYFGVEPASGAPFVHSGVNGLRHGLTLQAQPASLNILPLYIILLALFPLIYGLIAISPILALLASCALWIWVNLEPSINLTNWLDGQGWFFDPFAWQFLFVIGALGAVLLRRYDRKLPRPPWLRVVAWGIVASRWLPRHPGTPGAGPVFIQSSSMRRTKPSWRRCGCWTFWLSPCSRSVPSASASSPNCPRYGCSLSAGAIRLRCSR